MAVHLFPRLAILVATWCGILVGQVQGADDISAIEQRLHSLEARVDALTRQLNISDAGALRRDNHIAHLLSLLASSVYRVGVPAECPPGSMAVRTRTSPDYELCVHVKPFVIDSFLTTDGVWGSCEELRDWTMLIYYIMRLGKIDDHGLVYVDIGAHIGACVVQLAMLGLSEWGEPSSATAWVNYPQEFDRLPSLRVVAVEPDPIHAAMLLASLELNNVSSRVSVHERIAWHTSGEQRELRRFDFVNSGMNYVPAEHGGLWSSSEPSAGGHQSYEIVLADNFPKQTFSVPTATLDEMLLPEVAKGNLLVLKMDVEGQEMNALLGGHALFATDRVALVHFEFSTTLRRDGVRGSDIMHFFLMNHFHLLCLSECADLFPTFRGREIGRDDVEGFVGEQTDWGIDIVAVHDRFFTVDEGNWDGALKTVSSAFAQCPLVQRSD